jgi:hypothetical protein
MKPRAKTQEKIQFIIKALADGLTLQQIGTSLGITRAGVSQLCRNHGVNPKIGQIARRDQRNDIKQEMEQAMRVQRQKLAEKFRALCEPGDA